MPESFERLDAVAVPFEAANVDTDQILPARFLKKPRDGAYASYLFHDLRFDEQGREKPDFALNQPAFRDARIIVANANFGCGSSREGAVYALHDWGIRSIVAPSFSDIFFNNCLRNGVVPARLPTEVCARMRATLLARPGIRISVDLVAQQVRDPQGELHAFELDPFSRDLLMSGLDEIGLTLSMLPQLEERERAYLGAQPWALPLPNVPANAP